MQRRNVVDRFVRRLTAFPRGVALARAGAALGGFARIRTPMSTDELLQQLNGHSIDGDGDSWRIHVYSIVDGDAHRWIQLGLEGRETRTVLLKLTYLADACDAIGSVEQWMRNCSSRHGALVPVIPSID